MLFGLIKSIKSSHRNPYNRLLHLIGLPIYFTGITLIVGYFLDLHTNPVSYNSMTSSDWSVLDWSQDKKGMEFKSLLANKIDSLIISERR